MGGGRLGQEIGLVLSRLRAGWRLALTTTWPAGSSMTQSWALVRDAEQIRAPQHAVWAMYRGGQLECVEHESEDCSLWSLAPSRASPQPVAPTSSSHPVRTPGSGSRKAPKQSSPSSSGGIPECATPTPKPQKAKASTAVSTACPSDLPASTAIPSPRRRRSRTTTNSATAAGSRTPPHKGHP